MKKFVLWVAAFLVCSSLCLAQALPQPQNYVEDKANVINEKDEADINGVLRELEQKTTAQFIVLTVDTLNGQNIEAYSVAVAQGWKLGQKGKDNGVLLLVAVNDREYRIEVGYGLESVLPDGLVGQIGRDKMVPRFKAGDYGGGIRNAALDIASRIADANKIALGGLEQIKAERKKQEELEAKVILITLGIFAGLFVLFLIGSGIFSYFDKRKRKRERLAEEKREQERLAEEKKRLAELKIDEAAWKYTPAAAAASALFIPRHARRDSDVLIGQSNQKEQPKKDDDEAASAARRAEELRKRQDEEERARRRRREEEEEERARRRRREDDDRRRRSSGSGGFGGFGGGRGGGFGGGGASGKW